MDQDAGHFLRFALRVEIDCFDQNVRPLSLIRFTEADDRATERGYCPGLVVAMLSAQPSRRY